jgi:hypothetical protein
VHSDHIFEILFWKIRAPFAADKVTIVKNCILNDSKRNDLRWPEGHVQYISHPKMLFTAIYNI